MNKNMPTLICLLAAAALVHSVSSAAEPAWPRELTLTIDVAANARFREDVNTALLDTQRRLSGRLCHPLGTEPLATRPAFCTAEVRQAISHVLVLREGVIWRLASSHPAFLELPAPIGSVAKAVLATPLLAKAGARADERWCARAVPGLRNADGFAGHASCDTPGSRVTAVAAMARSNNLATIWRVGQLGNAQVRSELQRAQVSGLHADAPAAVAVVLGMAEVTPRQAIECFDAMARGRAQRAAITLQARGPATPMAQWCAEATTAPDAREFARQLLESPAMPGGTAAFLPGLFPGATHWMAKTGTPTDDATRDTAKLLMFAFRQRGVAYTVLLSVASPMPSWPLAERLSAGDLAVLAKLVARAVAAEHAAQ